jgi:hypothetical protein
MTTRNRGVLGEKLVVNFHSQAHLGIMVFWDGLETWYRLFNRRHSSSSPRINDPLLPALTISFVDSKTPWRFVYINRSPDGFKSSPIHDNIRKRLVSNKGMPPRSNLVARRNNFVLVFPCHCCQNWDLPSNWGLLTRIRSSSWLAQSVEHRTWFLRWSWHFQRVMKPLFISNCWVRHKSNWLVILNKGQGLRWWLWTFAWVHLAQPGSNDLQTKLRNWR